jgi:hypothetical protein
VRQAVKTSGIDGIALTKLDVLDGFDEIKVCTGYRLDGEMIDYLPASQGAQARVEPVYETIEGWEGSTAGARSWADLPAQAIKYVRYIEELIGAPVAVLSTSPERDDTILVHNPFEGCRPSRSHPAPRRAAARAPGQSRPCPHRDRRHRRRHRGRRDRCRRLLRQQGQSAPDGRARMSKLRCKPRRPTMPAS